MRLVSLTAAMLVSAAGASMAQAPDYARTPWQMHMGEEVIYLDTALAGFGTPDN